MKEEAKKKLIEHIALINKELKSNQIQVVVCAEHYINGTSMAPHVVAVKCHRSKVLASDWQKILAEAKRIHRDLGLEKCVLDKVTGDIVAGSMLSVRRNGESICCIMTKVPIHKETLFQVSNKLAMDTGFSTALVLPTHTHK